MSKRETPAAQVKVGNVTIPVSKWGDRHWVRWREDGRVFKRKFKSPEKAKGLARLVATRLSNGQPTLADLTAHDRELYRHACRTAEAEGFTLSAAIADWLRLRRNSPENKAPVTMETFFATFMADKADHKLSARHMRSLRGDLVPFIKAHPARAIQSLKAAEITLYLRDLTEGEGNKIGLRRRNNIRDTVVTFFRAAKQAELLPEDRKTEAEKVQRIELDDWTPTTFSPAELQLLLEHVSPEWLPWLCIAAFTGMRSEEIACEKPNKKGIPRQLMWSDFKWERRKIEVPAAIAKDRRRRLVPISDQLMAWLAPWRDRHGPVCPKQTLNVATGQLIKDRYDREIGRLAVKSGVTWRQDGLRHSFCSYWLALNHDIHELARTVGNSPAIIKRHYEDAKFPEEADAWFGILPDHPDNIVQLSIGLEFDRTVRPNAKAASNL